MAKDRQNEARAASGGNAYSAQKVRQGDIVLRRRWQRVVFIAGLAGMAVFVLVTTWLAL
jgi:hypothetical protein